MPHRGSLTPPSITPIDTIASSTLTIDTAGEGFVDITTHARRFIAEIGAREGCLSLFIRHTSASLTVQENADPDVLHDLTNALRRLAPRDGGWIHNSEGPDDMPAHIRTMLTSCSLQIPIHSGALALGTWQAIYLIEHRARPHRREIVLQFMGGVTS